MLCVKIELKVLYLLKSKDNILGAYINNNKGAVLEGTSINLYVETNISANRGLYLVRKTFNYNLV